MQTSQMLRMIKTKLDVIVCHTFVLIQHCDKN